MDDIAYRFRPGALETICASRNLATDAQLAALLGVTEQDLRRLRRGAPCNAMLALRVCAIQGTEDYVSAWFDVVQPPYRRTA